MEGLDLGQTSNPSLAWTKRDVFKINDDDGLTTVPGGQTPNSLVIFTLGEAMRATDPLGNVIN